MKQYIRCYSCGEILGRVGQIALLDGEARCVKCAKENRPWNKIYMDKR